MTIEAERKDQYARGFAGICLERIKDKALVKGDRSMLLNPPLSVHDPDKAHRLVDDMPPMLTCVSLGYGRFRWSYETAREVRIVIEPEALELLVAWAKANQQ